MDIYFITIQALGFMAFAMSLMSYQFENQKTMFAIRVCSDVLWASHYLLLSAITPAFTVAIASLRTFLAVFIVPRYRIFVIIGAISAVLALCHLYSEGAWQNYLPALTALVYGMSNYYHEDYLKSRILMLFGLMIWICIGVLFNSYAEIVSSTIGAISILTGFYRHKMQHRAT